MKKTSVGGLEFDVLCYITERQPVTVGEVAEGFGAPRQLARTTVQTMMERLRKKGVLARSEQDGVFRYTTQEARETVVRGLIHDFVQKALAGSLSPFFAYLCEAKEVTSEEFEELQKLVAKIEAQRKEQNQ